MMRPLLTWTLCGAIAAPGALLAQEVPAPDAAPAQPLALPASPPQPEEPAAPVVTQTAPGKAAVTPLLDGSAPTTVAPVVVEGKDAPKDANLGRKAGSVAGGVVGGVAGAAVAGPVGKFAGAFVGKRVAKTLFGSRKDKSGQQFQAAQTTPSADQAAADTEELSHVPPLREAAADPGPPTL